MTLTNLQGRLLELVAMATSENSGALVSYAKTGPARLFDDAEESVICRFLDGLAKVCRNNDTLNMRSFAYVNIPHASVTPLMAVMYLPPVDAGLEIYEARLLFQLDSCEELDQNVFVEMCKQATSNEGTGLQRWCWSRLVWIVCFVLNPFNLVLYRLDDYDGSSAELMGYPKYAVGDCEDTAEALQRFVRRLMTFPVSAGRTPAMRALLEFVSHYTVVQSVMTTRSASLAGAGTAKKPSLHMVAWLVPKTYIEDVGESVDLQGVSVFTPIILEATGFNYGACLNPQVMFGSATPPVILDGLRAYNALRTKLSKLAPVQKEMMMIPAMSPGDAQQPLWWGAPGFYDRIVSFHFNPDTVSSSSRSSGVLDSLLDVTYRGNGQPVKFIDFVAGRVDLWQLTKPAVGGITEDDKAQLVAVCKKTADNVCPIDSLDTPLRATLVDKWSIHNRELPSSADRRGGIDLLAATAPRHLTLYMNYAAYKNADAAIEEVLAACRGDITVADVKTYRVDTLSASLSVTVMVVRLARLASVAINYKE